MGTHDQELGAASRRARADGASLVEFAIIAPLLLLLIFGVVEFARIIATYTGVYTAAREGARYGSTVGDSADGIPRYLDCDGIEEAAKAKAVMVDPDALTITVEHDGHTCDPAGPAGEVTVHAETTFTSPFPILSVFLDGVTVEAEQTRSVVREIVDG
jgi:Flp pilus assembly protein TadG